MPNPIKYTTGTESQALKKGNFYIGTGDVGKGPSDTTGFYQGISPSSGGYVIYMNKSGAPGDLSYHNAPTDAELISFTNSLAGQSFTGVNQCLVYFAGQTDKVCVNRDYEGIVTDGLVLNLDAGFTPSYPRSGTTWSDMGGSNNGTLTNGPTFNSDNGGNIVFDGTNDFVSSQVKNTPNGQTMCSWIKTTSVKSDKSYLGDASNTIVGDTRNSVWNGFGVTNGKLNYNNASKNDNWRQYNSNQSVNDGNWKYLSVTFNKSTDIVSLYINGSLDSTYNNESSGGQYDPWTFMGFNVIGRGYGGDYFDGTISVVMVYDASLTSSEVLQNYNAQKERFGL